MPMLLHSIISFLPLPLYTTLQTSMTIHDEAWPGDIEAFLATSSDMHITTLNVHTREIDRNPNRIIQHLTNRTSDNKWKFPALQHLKVVIRGVAPGLLAQMVRARYGVSVELGPLPLKALVVHQDQPHHASERVELLEILGPDVLSWYVPRTSPAGFEVESEVLEE